MTSTQTPLVAEARQDDSINLLDLATSFLLEWRKFLLVTAVIFAVGAALVFHIKPLYEASASILPQSHDENTNLASFFSGRSPGDVVIGLLASRSVADDVIDRAGLMAIYKTNSREAARGMLAKVSVFTAGKDTMVNIKVRDRDATDAMRIANAYLESLQVQREKMLAHEAEVHNRFFEQLLSQQAEDLAAAEQELKQVQENSGVVQPEAQTQIGLNAIANTSAQISALRVQLASLLLGQSEQNPEVKALRAQIAQLEAHLGALQSSGATGAGSAASARKMPQLNLEIARRQRNVRYHETLLNSISTQYQNARLGAGNSGAPFVIVDRPVVPESRAWPPRLLLLAVALALSIIAGITFVGLLLLWRSIKLDPENQARGAAIRRSFGLSPTP